MRERGDHGPRAVLLRFAMRARRSAALSRKHACATFLFLCANAVRGAVVAAVKIAGTRSLRRPSPEDENGPERHLQAKRARARAACAATSNMRARARCPHAMFCQRGATPRVRLLQNARAVRLWRKRRVVVAGVAAKTVEAGVQQRRRARARFCAKRHATPHARHVVAQHSARIASEPN